jgi:hypothetical protein
MKKLYTFSALLQYNYVVAAENEKLARKAIESYEDAWTTGDFGGVKDIELVDVSKADQDAIDDFAHEIYEG